MSIFINRRTLLKRVASAAMLPMAMRVMTSEAAAASQTILVVVDLSGGNDGLNTIVPLQQYGAYSGLRKNIGLAAPSLGLSFNSSPSTAIGSGTQYAFHPAMGHNLQKNGSPAMGGLPALYQQGRLAIVVGAGLPDTDSQRFDHACARDDWAVGKPNAWDFGGDGWLGLALDNASAGLLGPTASMTSTKLITKGQKYSGVVIGNQLSDFPTSFFGSAFPVSTSANWLAKPNTKSAAMAFSYGLSQRTFQAAQSVASINSTYSLADYPYLNGGGTYFEQQLSAVAQLIRGGAGVSGYVTELDGFDTHDNQTSQHPALLSNLSGGLANFYAYLKKYNVSSNVVIMTISDFGRTPHDNTANGTDHGLASVAFVLGDPVTGGVYGDYPSLTQLDEGQIPVTVNYQNIISDVVTKIGGNPQTILGQSYPRLGFI
jgi:uncharacterized protein (DUF1501 family)